MPADPLRPGDDDPRRARRRSSRPATGEPGRVALVVDGAGSMHGVTHTIERIREHGVPGWEVEVIGTDPRVDRRLPAVAEVEVPFYAGLTIGVPSVPELVETLADGRYDLIHVASPGPAGDRRRARAPGSAGIPLVGSYHTELAAYAGLRTGDPALEAGMRLALSLFYRQCEVVLSPSPASDESLAVPGDRPGTGSAAGRAASTCRSTTRLGGDPDLLPGRGQGPLRGPADQGEGRRTCWPRAFLRARERDPRLHLLLAGGGPEEEMLRVRLGRHGDLPRLARPRAARATPTRAPTCSCSARRPTPTAR